MFNTKLLFCRKDQNAKKTTTADKDGAKKDSKQPGKENKSKPQAKGLCMFSCYCTSECVAALLGLKIKTSKPSEIRIVRVLN